MVGGGEGAFIGAVHRMAANLDGQIELVCGAFSSDPERSKRSGAALYLAPERCYEDYQQMMAAEALLPATERMDFVAIVTPNHMHFPIARAAIEQGFHVMSDKPATLDLNEVLELRALLEGSGLLFGLTHTYTGYPMVKEARAQVLAGELGSIRKVLVEYPQGWLSEPQDSTENKQAAWRLDPSKAGVSSCMGDIGVHAFNLAEYISNLQVTELCADLHSFVDRRLLDDDGSVLLRFGEQARGALTASQVCLGEENDLRIRIYGDKASLDWRQQEPNTLLIKYQDKPAQVLRAGSDYLSPVALANCRTPGGHPEGYLEAFANLYRNFASQIKAQLAGEAPCAVALDLPGINEGVRGMAFIEQVVAASGGHEKWHQLPSY